MGIIQNVKDVIEGAKLVKEKRLKEEKTRALNDARDLMAVYADNVVTKFKVEYNIACNRGKRVCKITFNPYPNDALWKKMLNKVNKAEYLVVFEEVLREKIAQHGFNNILLTETMFNAKEPITLRVEW